MAVCFASGEAKTRRCLAGLPFESAGEIRALSITAPFGNFLDSLIGIHEKAGGKLEAFLCAKVPESQSEDLP